MAGEVPEVGVGGFESRVSDRKLVFLACEEYISFLFLKTLEPACGIAGDVSNRGGAPWWPPVISPSVPSGVSGISRILEAEHYKKRV